MTTLTDFAWTFQEFSQLSESAGHRFALRPDDCMPCLDDATATTGFDRHYVYHLAWAARVVAETKPAVHVDLSSSLHFCTLLSAFVPVDFYDYRPADIHLDNLVSRAADLTALPFSDASVPSLSCMHVVEHVGLGRYGDPLDPDGDLKAMSELARVLAPGGTLLFVVPVGVPRIVFNAHRIYGYDQVVDAFDGLELVEFALIPAEAGNGGLVRNASPALVATEHYGCGCFWFRRPL